MYIFDINWLHFDLRVYHKFPCIPHAPGSAPDLREWHCGGWIPDPVKEKCQGFLSFSPWFYRILQPNSKVSWCVLCPGDNQIWLGHGQGIWWCPNDHATLLDTIFVIFCVPKIRQNGAQKTILWPLAIGLFWTYSLGDCGVFDGYILHLGQCYKSTKTMWFSSVWTMPHM
jgi:hypothetical protein